MTVRSLGDTIAEDGTTGTGLRRRTIQTGLKRLEELGRARVAVASQYDGNEWEPVAPVTVDTPSQDELPAPF